AAYLRGKSEYHKIMRAFSADDQCTPNRALDLAYICPPAVPDPVVFWSGVHPDPLRLTVAAEQQPAQTIFAPFLADPCRRQIVLVGHVQCSFAEQEVIDDTTVTLAAAANPQREVKAKDNLLRHRRLRVVAETLLETVLGLLTVRVGVAILVRATGRAGQRLDHEVVSALGQRIHDVLALVFAA